ncbi:pyranose dehydrogenase [Cyathus striatus]|nr:pyranose dehydrogenase [Cyathus striatus]
MKYVPTLLLFHVFIVPLCLAKIYQNFRDLSTDKFDFVIVGGGLAGLVVANRLTEIPELTVLVIEAGPSNEGVFDSVVPFLGYRLEAGFTPWDWNSTMVPQPELDNRTLLYARAHMLGGCTSHNGLIYARGSSNDYDHWANVTGDSGWSWENIFPYILKSEGWTPPADHHNTTGQYNPSFHSVKGPLSVSLPGYHQVIDDPVIQTTRELPDLFPFVQDVNTGHFIGIGWTQATIGHGVRSSSATTYLSPIASRSNLHVLLGARVTRVLQTSGKKELLFGKVEFVSDINGTTADTHTVFAEKEIILSAGIIGTPQLLLNSGIGDKDELKALGVKPVLHLPDVGKNLSNHLILDASWISNTTGNDLVQNATLLTESLVEWNRSKTGPLVAPSSSQMGGIRLPSNSSVFINHTDPTFGPNTPHIYFATTEPNGFFQSVPGIELVGLIGWVVAPQSRGHVTISSNNPLDQPIIDAGFLTNEYDMLVAIEVIKHIRKFFTAPVWKDILVAPYHPTQDEVTDDQIEAYIHQSAVAASHGAGTAAMSPKGAGYGVVDPDLNVKGTSGLRVVDGSVIPSATSGNNQAPIYAVAERAADLIKHAWIGGSSQLSEMR